MEAIDATRSFRSRGHAPGPWRPRGLSRRRRRWSACWGRAPRPSARAERCREPEPFGFISHSVLSARTRTEHQRAENKEGRSEARGKRTPQVQLLKRHTRLLANVALHGIKTTQAFLSVVWGLREDEDEDGGARFPPLRSKKMCRSGENSGKGCGALFREHAGKSTAPQITTTHGTTPEEELAVELVVDRLLFGRGREGAKVHRALGEHGLNSSSTTKGLHVKAGGSLGRFVFLDRNADHRPRKWWKHTSESKAARVHERRSSRQWQ